MAWFGQPRRHSNAAKKGWITRRKREKEHPTKPWKFKRSKIISRKRRR